MRGGSWPPGQVIHRDHSQGRAPPTLPATTAGRFASPAGPLSYALTGCRAADVRYTTETLRTLWQDGQTVCRSNARAVLADPVTSIAVLGQGMAILCFERIARSRPRIYLQNPPNPLARPVVLLYSILVDTRQQHERKGKTMTGEQITNALQELDETSTASEIDKVLACASNQRPNGRQWAVLARAELRACERLGVDVDPENF